MDMHLVLLDDGEFYVERNANFDRDTANGFLHRRCAVSLTAPGGYECIGSYERRPGGTWNASINASYDPETDSDSRELGDTFKTNVEAIAALWSARHEAYCGHQ